MMTQQATMLAFLDCFHLLGLAVLIGLPLAWSIRRFEIGKIDGLAAGGKRMRFSERHL